MMNLQSTIRVQTLQQQREHAARLKQRWRDGETADALAAIAEIGGTIVHKSVAIELAYEEYCQRKAAGENIQSSEFAGKFPDFQYSLKRQIGIHQFLSERGVTHLDNLPEWPEAGDEVAGFLLKEELGRGAFGRVFLAHELKLRERTVVVKVARQGLREAQLLAQVSHPGIVPIYSAESDPEWGLTTICMPFNSRATLLDVLEFNHTLSHSQQDGLTILAAVANRNCSDDQLTLLPQGTAVLTGDNYLQAVIQFTRLLADSLQYAHLKGVQHRDLKPSNILVNSAGHPLLIDFNLSTEPTSEDFIGGTLPYMSPEQLIAVLTTSPNSGFEIPRVDQRSDLYSLGICVYQLWNGHHPIGEVPHQLDQTELADYLLERQAIGPVSGRPATDAREHGFNKFLSHCLSFYAEERFQSADELLTDLDRIAQIDVSIEAPPSVWSRKWIGLIAVCCLISAVGLFWIGLQPQVPVATAPRDLYAEAREFITLQEFDKAINVLNEAIQVDGENDKRLSLRGRSRLELNRYSEAFDDFQRSYELSPSMSSAAFAAYSASSLGKHQAAVDWYQIASKKMPNSLSVRNNLGYSLLQISRYKDAIAQLDAAIAISPEHPAPRLSRAIAYFQQAELTGEPLSPNAAEDLERAVGHSYGRSAVTMLTAARICARCDPPNDRLRSCLSYAVLLGSNPDFIRQDPDFAVCRDEPWFEDVMSVPISKVTYDNVRLISPW